MSRLCELNPEETARGLARRKVFCIRCCGKKMRQMDVFSSLPREGRNFGVSKVVLHCLTCRRSVELELLISNVSRREVWESLGVSRRVKG